MHPHRYTLTRFAPLCIRAVRSLRWASLGLSAQSVFLVLTRCRDYSQLRDASRLADPFVLLVLSLIISLLRIGIDPNVIASSAFIGVPHELGVILVSLGSILGALLIPIFWYSVLGIRIERDVFVAAMIVTYAVVEIPWDLLYPLWFSLVVGGISDVHIATSTPVWVLWLPDTLKTLIITVYCSMVAASLHRVQALQELETERE